MDRAPYREGRGGFTRRRLIGGAAAGAGMAAGGALLAACRSPSDGGGGGQAGAVCQEKMEIWSAFGTGTVQAEAMNQLTGDFAKGKPGCSVEVVVLPTDLVQKLTAAVAAGSPPASATLAPSQVTTWSAQGLLQPVDDLFKRDRLSAADFPAPLWQNMNFTGKTWFLPLYANADFVLHWNKGHFREAGLDAEKGPQTIDELDRLIPVLTREQGSTLERLGMVPWNLYGLGNTFQAWGFAFGGSFKDEARDELTFTHPRIQRAVEWYTGWAARLGAARVAQMEATYTPPGGNFFSSNKLSIHPLTSPQLRFVRRHDPSIEIGAGIMPGEPPGQPGTVAIGGWATGVIAGTKQRGAAWELVKYLGADDEGTLGVARLMGLPGWLKSPGLVELAQDPLQRAYVEGIKRAQFPQLGFYSAGGWDLNPIQEVIDGQRSVKDALEAINRDANQRYQEWKRQTRKG
ncbi:MAG TPA: extracellular solute-binding protein [Chloroflexota bacterium]|jgi:multiple sugar transport system substrate-binding protein|nr:extracellular solute-binding protein [Chloroflexota bacterium]